MTDPLAVPGVYSAEQAAAIRARFDALLVETEQLQIRLQKLEAALKEIAQRFDGYDPGTNENEVATIARTALDAPEE